MLEQFRGFAIILIFYYFGEFVHSRLGFPLPGSVVGMLLLFVSLQSKCIKVEWITHSSKLLLLLLPFLFIPMSAGVASYSMHPLVWLKFGLTLFLLTALGIIIVGKTVSRARVQ